MRMLFAAVALLLSLASAQAACPTVITAPCTIESDGYYVLGANLNVTNVAIDSEGYQNGIRIGAGVTLASINCDIFAIYHEGSYTSRGVGIRGSSVANVDIFGCNIFGQGMLFGVLIENDTNPAYDNIKLRDSVISARLVGAVIRSKSVTVTNTLCRYMGRQAIWSDNFPGCLSVFGLASGGNGILISGVHAYRFENPFNSEVFGVSCSNCYGAVIRDISLTNYTLLAASYAYWINPGNYTIENVRANNFDVGLSLVGGSTGTITGYDMGNANVPLNPAYDPDDWLIVP